MSAGSLAKVGQCLRIRVVGKLQFQPPTFKTLSKRRGESYQCTGYWCEAFTKGQVCGNEPRQRFLCLVIQFRPLTLNKISCGTVHERSEWFYQVVCQRECVATIGVMQTYRGMQANRNYGSCSGGSENSVSKIQ